MPGCFPPPSFTGQRPANSGQCRPQDGQEQRVGETGSVEERTGAGQSESPSGEILTPTSPQWVLDGLPDVVAALKGLPLEERVRIASELLRRDDVRDGSTSCRHENPRAVRRNALWGVVSLAVPLS